MSRLDVVMLGSLALLAVTLSRASGSRHQLSGFQPIFNQDEVVHRKKGATMRRYMNLSASPCDDFYAFACGNYDQPTSPLDDLRSKVDSDLQAILQTPAKVQDHLADVKLKNFYKSCQAVSRNGASQQAFFSAFITNHSGFPAVPGINWLEQHHNYNWLEVIARLRHNFGMDILIGLRVDLNPVNPNENSIYLGEPQSSLIPAELCNAEATQRIDLQDRAYEAVEKATADNLLHWLTLRQDEAKRVAADIVTFEFELCTAMRATPPPAAAENLTRKSLTELTAQLNHSIDLYSYVSSCFQAPYYKPVVLTSEPYFRQLVKTMGDHNLTTIANYIMYRALTTFSLPSDDRRNGHCLAVLRRYLPALLGDMYKRHYASAAAKDQVEHIFRKVKHAFEHNSLRNVWFEEGTSRLGKMKLSQITLAFASHDDGDEDRGGGGGDDLRHLQLNAGNFWLNLAEAMALRTGQQVVQLLTSDRPRPSDTLESYETRLRYWPGLKRVDIGWAPLRSPFYEPLQPLALSYATIGSQLGAMLATAFDDENWSADNRGISNWDRQTEREYATRSECFRRQLSNYLHNNPQTFRNGSSVRHLIAASGGLNVAFNAYLDWLFFLSPNNDFVALSKETLPEVNYTNTQLFFIAFAQMHCRAAERRSATATSSATQTATAMAAAAAATARVAALSPLAVHTMQRYEVNGPLQNSPEFGREFGCRTGAEMNPVVKCMIY